MVSPEVLAENPVVVPGPTEPPLGMDVRLFRNHFHADLVDREIVVRPLLLCLLWDFVVVVVVVGVYGPPSRRSEKCSLIRSVALLTTQP